MAVSVNADVLYEPLANPYLPKDVQRWRVGATVTGDATAGLASMIVRHNPDSRNDWQPFATLHRLVFRATAADPTDGYYYFPRTEWEDLSFFGTDLLAEELVTTQAFAGEYLVQAIRVPIYLGRIAKGSPGSIRVDFPNVNLAVYRVFMSGLSSQRPFLAWETVRV